MWNKDIGICLVCNLMDCERLYCVYIEMEMDLLNRNYIMFYIVFEVKLRDWFNEYKNIMYVCGDLELKDLLMKEIDVIRIIYDSNIFDVILCSYVLEYVFDDDKVM